MADTIKAEAVVDNVANGDADMKNPAETASGEGESEQKSNGGVAAEVKEKAKAGKAEESKDEKMEDAAAGEKNEEAQSNGDKADHRTHSPDNKRKDNNDHYRDGNKRSRADGHRERGRGRGGRGGHGGNRGGPKFAKNANIKRTFEDQPESNDPEEIRRQVEFYFSDSNLPVDGYLLGMVEASKNLPVDLRTIHNFKRMRHFQPFSAVTEAIKESEVLDVEERDNTAFVTRKTPLPEKFTLDTIENKKLLTTDTMERSIYAKGFGDETRSTHLDIEELFAPYGPTNSIRLRRAEDGAFKGSVFVEFADVATQARFLQLDPKPTWGPDNKELQILSKQVYVDRKQQDIHDGNVRPGRSHYRGHNNKRGGREGRGGYHNRHNSDNRDRSRSPGRDDWKQRRDRDQRNGNRDDRKRGGRGGGDRDNRKRSRSPRKDEEMRDSEQEPLLSRAEAEVKRAEDGKETNGASEAEPVAMNDVKAGAEKAEGASKKRAREETDDGAAEGGDAKKVKESEVDA